MKLTVSVVIPAYNEEKDIAKCLDSLMHQTVKPDEIILVNNNSTDATVSIASEYPSVKIINEKQKGITYSRTAGFNAAKSDIIARLDADTIAAEYWVDAIKKKFASDKTICALKGRVAVRELSPRGLFWFSGIGFFWRTIGDFFIGVNIGPLVGLSIGPLLSGHNMAVRKSVWDKVKDHVFMGDEEINEDVDLSLFIKKVGPIVYCHDMLAKTRMLELWFNYKKLIKYGQTNKSTIEKHALLDKQGIDFSEETTR